MPFLAYLIHRVPRGDETIIRLEPLGLIPANSPAEALTDAHCVYPALKHQICIGEYHAPSSPSVE